MLYTNLVHATREANKWDLRFLKQAAEVSSWSKDPSTKVGAILASQDNQQIVIGYNGYPSRLADNQHEHTREERLARSIHAELNAIFNAKRPLSSYRMYVYPFLPCGPCASNIVQNEIIEVCVPLRDANGEPFSVPDRWIPSMAEAARILRDGGVQLTGLLV